MKKLSAVDSLLENDIVSIMQRLIKNYNEPVITVVNQLKEAYVGYTHISTIMAECLALTSESPLSSVNLLIPTHSFSFKKHSHFTPTSLPVQTKTLNQTSYLWFFHSFFQRFSLPNDLLLFFLKHSRKYTFLKGLHRGKAYAKCWSYYAAGELVLS